MCNIAEIFLKFKIAQLEGKIAIYETLIGEIAKLESMEKAASDVKDKLEGVAAAWNDHLSKELHDL
jgi:glycine cleavage system H lipoate-binding protein